MQNDPRKADAMLRLVIANASDDPVEAIGFARRTRMRNNQLSNVGMLSHYLLDLALRLGIVYVSTDKDVKIMIIDIADCIQQRSPDDRGLLPSRKHQGKRLLGLLRHLLETGQAISRSAGEP